MVTCLPQTMQLPPWVRSWITPKAAKGGASAIEEQGVHAVEPIAPGEVVAVKGGHIVDGPAVAALPDAIRDSAFPIAPDCFLAALTEDEHDGVMMRVDCRCGAAAYRGVVRGTDWMRADLQRRYRGWFAWWLQQKIVQTRPAR